MTKEQIQNKLREMGLNIKTTYKEIYIMSGRTNIGIIDLDKLTYTHTMPKEYSLEQGFEVIAKSKEILEGK